MRRLAFVLVAGAALLTAAGAIAAVAATPSQRPAQEPIDSDKDGLTDPYDACVLKPGGPYDSNKNGCPGPYNWLPMHISYGRGSYIEGGITYLRALSLSGLPAGTKVTIRGRGVYLGPAMGIGMFVEDTASSPPRRSRASVSRTSRESASGPCSPAGSATSPSSRRTATPRRASSRSSASRPSGRRTRSPAAASTPAGSA